MEGNIIGSVTGLAGHLGCIAYNPEDGRVYGSLEYKHDSIGQSILNNFSEIKEVQNGFYIVSFDVDKINRENMNSSEVMKAAYLKEVVEDYSAPGHRYGCSGIDGTTIAPAIGKTDGDLFLYVAYGVYSDVERKDNDYQVILCYNLDKLKSYMKSLNQLDMHRKGPEEPEHKYFVYTGNTNFGVQNLEYDPYKNRFLMAVYPGIKDSFPNYNMFSVDCLKAAETKELQGIGHKGEVLSLIPEWEENSGVYGSYFSLGTTGMISLGDGYYYFSKDFYVAETNEFGSAVTLWRADDKENFKLA